MCSVYSTTVSPCVKCEIREKRALQSDKTAVNKTRMGLLGESEQCMCVERTDDEVDATLTLLYCTNDTRSTQDKESEIAEAMARKLGRRRLTVYGLRASATVVEGIV